MSDQFLITPEAPGHQRNALRVEIIPPQSRCALLPMTDSAVFARARFNWRTDLLSRDWGNFDYCNHNPGGCATCPFFQRHQERQSAPTGSVIASDPVNNRVWWILPEALDRWGRFGYYYRSTERASSLANLVRQWAIDIDPNWKRDGTGTYYNTVKDESDYLSINLLMHRK